MIERRNFLALLSTGLASSWIEFPLNQRSLVGFLYDQTPSAQSTCVDNFADPPWKRLSSSSGDLPVPQTSDQQTGCVVGDIDGDGRLDFAITNREHGNAAIWMQNTTQGWKQHIMDPGPLNIEAGGALFDVDGDGCLDLVAGGDGSSNEVWWWENPHPIMSAPGYVTRLRHRAKHNIMTS